MTQDACCEYVRNAVMTATPEQLQMMLYDGAIRFARLTEKELLPVRIEARGPYPPRYPFHFPRVTVLIGKALSVLDLEAEIGPTEGRENRNLLLSKRLMERIDAVESGKGGG